MKKIYKCFIVVLSTVVSLSSCNKFLDVKQEDKLLDEQVFSSAKNIKAYLNGLYVKLGGSALYGENLTLSVPDILAQSYNVGGNHSSAQLASYTYGGTPSSTISSIWSSAYSTIFNVNQFMSGLDKAAGVLDANTDSIYRGEALAIRAMIHFDLLRLFGPRYSTPDSISKDPNLGIPYNTADEVIVNPILPANKVMNLIMADLSRAERLLSTDMSMTYERKYKFTYYSVKALQARVNLYRGNKTEALACAMVLINNSNKFPWVVVNSFIGEKASPDKIFSSEMIFGAYNPDLYKVGFGHIKLFNANLSDASILAPNDARLTALYPEATDVRFGFQFWDQPANKDYKTFLKYTEAEDKTKLFRNTVPLLKLSEMYYIAAECEAEGGNMTTASNYLNMVRANRGINTIAFPVTATPVEILREYRKEFYGEGQLWYYYKRTNATTILDGTKTGTQTVTPIYVIPKPTAEMIDR